MAKPYSMDLRERVVAAVEQGGLSRHAAALRFGVGVSTAITWVRRFQETGNLAPGQMGGHKPKAIRGAHEVWLRWRLGEREFTLRAGWSPNSPIAALRSITERCGTLFTPRS